MLCNPARLVVEQDAALAGNTLLFICNTQAMNQQIADLDTTL